MKTAKEKVVEFMIEKDRIVYEATNIRLMVREDWEEMETWDEELFVKFIEDLSAWGWTDAQICPFCERFGLSCGRCSYGKRHGLCNETEDDTYSQIVEKNNSGISRLDGVHLAIKNLIGEK